jgi:cell division inhibitor SepF
VKTILGKLKDIINGGNENYQYYEQEMEQMSDRDLHNLYEEPIPGEEEEEPQPQGQPRARRRSRDKSHFQLQSETMMGTDNMPNNVIGMPGINHAMNEVVVIEPHSFDEIPQVIQTLRERRSVVLNLNVMSPDEAQRAVDFVAGGTYAIDGHQERIGESIFLFTPNSVKVSTITGTSERVKQSLATSNDPSMSSSLWDEDTTPIAQ